VFPKEKKERRAALRARQQNIVQTPAIKDYLEKAVSQVHLLLAIREAFNLILNF
jgi:hypothetical protein